VFPRALLPPLTMARTRSFTLPFVAALALAGGAFVPAGALTVYTDSLAAGWANWSWDGGTNLGAPSPSPARGTHAIAFTPGANWNGMYLHHGTLFPAGTFEAIRMWIHGGGSGGQQLRLQLYGGSFLGEIDLDAAVPGGIPSGWVEVTIPLSSFGGAIGSIDGFAVMSTVASAQPTVYFDDLELVENTTPPPPPGPLAVTVSPELDRRTIDPRIYGVNFGNLAQHQALGFPVRRWGGNATTRYNFQNDVGNHAFDYFFQNVPEGPDPGTLPVGSTADRFIDETLTHGGDVVLTVPTIGWVPIDTDRNKRHGFSVAKYGTQTQVECSIYLPNPPAWCSWDAGNGRCDPATYTPGSAGDRCDDASGLIVGNDPLDTSQPADETFVGSWMDHLLAEFGTATNGGVRFYALDNEPMLWNSTHRDVHPEPATYDEVWEKGWRAAEVIKQKDPTAEVLGPVTWGWCDLFGSALDAVPTPQDPWNCLDGPDRQSHGGVPFVQWYLRQACGNEHPGLIDYLDIHYYPQGGVDGLGAAASSEDAATAAKRLASVKELWHPTWVADSWIAANVRLIPRLRAWIDTECGPEDQMKLAITEYKWGGDHGITGALAQVEVLALFGREGVDLATRWVAPEPGSLAEDAFALFLDYDGQGARVLGESVRALSADHDAVASYAMRGSGDELWLLLINKDTNARLAEVRIDGGIATGPGQTPVAIRLDDVPGLSTAPAPTVVAGGFDATLPARTATLVVARRAASAPPLGSDDFELGNLTRWNEHP
jgi:hypothetical protein